MLIEKILKDNHYCFPHIERYVHLGTYPEPRELSEVHSDFGSYYGGGLLSIPFFVVPRDELTIYISGNCRKEVLNFACDSQTVNFPVHPQIAQEACCPEIERLKRKSIRRFTRQGIPTASIRTLLIEDEGGEIFFVKTHLPKRVSSVTRDIREKEVVRGQWMNEEFRSILDMKLAPQDMGYYPDSVGLIYNSDSSSVGGIYRGFHSYPYRANTKISLPLFSLYSKDVLSPNDSPLIFQLSSLLGMDPADYAIEQVVEPHLKHWVFLFKNRGILFNSHGQNGVMSLNSDLSLNRIGYRDMQGNPIVVETRRKSNLPLPQEITLREENLNLPLEASISYDFIMGYLFYDRLLEPLIAKGYSKQELTGRIKSIFHNLIPDSKDYFPKTMQYYKGRLANRRIVDTGQVPVYR